MQFRCPGCGHGLVDDTHATARHCPSCGRPAAPLATESAGTWLGGARSLGRFTLLARLGAGAAGVVWKAHDPLLDRLVALKVSRARDAAADDAWDLLREARSAAQLRHPHIVRVHEVGRDGDSVYIVSDLVDGVTLADWLAEHRPAPREAASLCSRIARALQHAHDHGVVHRDLKPGNVMRGRDGQPYVLDFGLARRESGEATVTRKGQIVGTPAYMSPEQARGDAHAADGRTDVYSLGVILFEMLAGRTPFRGTSMMLLYRRLHDDPPSPRRFNRAVPRDLERVCLKALARAPEDRYPTAADFADDLDRFLAGAPVRARRLGPLRRGWRIVRRRPAALAAVAVAAIVAVIPAYSSVQERERQARLEARVVHSEFVRDSLRMRRLAGWADSPRYRDAAAEAQRLRDAGRISPGRCYDLACLFALAARSAHGDLSLSDAERNQLVPHYRASALELLTQARRSGYFSSPDRRDHLLHDPQLDFLRGNPQFEHYVQGVMEDGYASLY